MPQVTSIPHASIARLCVESLSYANAGRTTLCAMQTAEPGQGSSEWKPLLATVKADRRAFRQDLLQEHKKAVLFGGMGIAAGVCAFTLLAGFAVKAIVMALVGLVVR